MLLYGRGDSEMNDNRYLSDLLLKLLNDGSPVVIASIISMEGSLPRESGARMIIASGGKSYGTIGGSLMEAKAIADSAAVLAEGKSRLLEFDLTGGDTSSEDMICGGKSVVLLDYIPPTGSNREMFRQMSDLISGGNNFYFLTGYTGSGEDVNITGHCILFGNGRTTGDKIIPDSEILVLREELHNMSSTTVYPSGGINYVIDPIRKIKTLYCFGAGHVALPTAHIASMVGFKVVVIDDREEYANRQRFPDAEKILVIEDFNRALEGLPIDKDSFIIILTRGHRYDRVVLEQALKTDAGYIGMISSITKRDSVYDRLVREGTATREELERVHSPIGLDIGGDTPEEIAVSIVAQLIHHREHNP
jgi:xanthine dehydrogenase accessory factor